MKARIGTALVGIPLAAMVVHAGGAWFFAVALCLALMCVRELEIAIAHSAQTRGARVSWLAYLAVAALLSAAFVDATSSCLWSILGSVVLGIWCVGVWQFGRGDSEKREAGQVLLSVTLTQAVVAYCALWAFVVLLRARGEAWMWLCLLGVWSSDIAAFFAGRAFGRRKLTPLSPGKTREGALGGFIVTLMICALIGAQTELGIVAGLLCGAAIGVSAPLGDLAQSLWKRELGLKDLGSLLPGHGGITDRCDSLLFAAAAVYALSWLF